MSDKLKNSSNLAEAIFERIDGQRRRRRITIDQLMEKMGYKTRNPWYTWEKNPKAINIGTIVRIASVLNCTTDYLFGLVDVA